MIVVCPLGRPGRLERVLAMWGGQTLDSELVLVPGRRPLGTVPKNVVVLDAEHTIGAAKNAGMQFGRSRSHTWCAFFDDDNYYGPRYLEQIAMHERAGDVLSQGIGFVRHERGLAYYGNRPGFAPSHSTAVRLAAAPEFPALSFEEDLAWSQKLDRPIVWLPPWHAVYYRTGDDHAYQAGDAVFRYRFGPAVELGALPDELVDTPDVRLLRGPRRHVSLSNVCDELASEARAYAARLREKVNV